MPTRMIRAALLVPALFAAVPALAQASDEIIRESAGSYHLVPTDGKPVCAVRLDAARTAPDTYRATPATCPHFPAVAKVAAWRLLDGTLLLDAKGNTLMHFVEDETALPAWPDLQSPKLYLVPAIAGFTHLPQAEEWVGSWKLQRNGKPVCTITLSATRNGTANDTRKLSATACPGATAKLRSWSLEDMRLMLWGPNDQMIAFSPAAKGRWTSDEGGWSLSK